MAHLTIPTVSTRGYFREAITGKGVCHPVQIKPAFRIEIIESAKVGIVLVFFKAVEGNPWCRVASRSLA